MKWKLKAAMEECNDNMTSLAEYLEITYQTLSKKINGHTDFTQTEIKKIKERYKLSALELDIIFFS